MTSSPAPLERSFRWGSGARGALLVSMTVHVVAVAAVSAVISATRRHPAEQPVTVDIEIAPAPRLLEEAPASTRVTAPRQRREVAPRDVAARREIVASTQKAIPTDPIGDQVEDGSPIKFALSAGTVAATPGNLPSPVREADRAGEAVGEGDVTVPARLLSSSPLVYTRAARNAEIEVDVPLEIVVGIDGRVSAARALTRIGYGLEDAALSAIRAYRFSPALRAGHPVRVRMRWTVQFRLG